MLRILIALIGLLVAIQSTAQTCNPNIAPSAPDSRYQGNGDGSVTDHATGLMWRQCSEGQGGDGCSTGSAGYYTWQQALQIPATLNASGGYAGYADWRLPNSKELESLVEVSCYAPAINANYFPYTPTGAFWSASPHHAGGSGSVWYVYFDDGGAYATYYRDYNNHVRLVRGGQ